MAGCGLDDCCGRFNILGWKGAAGVTTVAGLAFELRLCSAIGIVVRGTEPSLRRICCGTNVFGSGFVKAGEGPREVALTGACAFFFTVAKSGAFTGP